MKGNKNIIKEIDTNLYVHMYIYYNEEKNVK